MVLPGPEGGSAGRLQSAHLQKCSVHVSFYLLMQLKCGARREGYGLRLTILETKMENFKNSVKTLNENSQAVQTKAGA